MARNAKCLTPARRGELHVGRSVTNVKVELALGQGTRAGGGMLLALGGIPIVGGKGDAPEERRWLDKFEADFGLAGILLPDKGYGARQFFDRLGIDDGELLSSHEFRRKPQHAAVCVHRDGERFFGERHLSVLSADEDRIVDWSGVGRRAVRLVSPAAGAFEALISRMQIPRG